MSISDQEIRARAREYVELEEDSTFRSEAERLIEQDDYAELRERFAVPLEFGTGGLRGIVGAGFGRMNPLMVRRATQGLAAYILEQAPDHPHSVVIAFDSRRYSREFAEEAACVLAANGIKAYVFSELRPTPELSFAVRRLEASAGIVITASHNPPEYNGYKVYWADGSQIVAPHDGAIIERVRSVKGSVPALDRGSAEKKGLFKSVDELIDAAYVDMVLSYLNTDQIGSDAEFSVVYTPLHGTGGYLTERILEAAGIPYVTVPEQREPDGEFPTVESPNPEEGAALGMGIALAKSTGADMVMGTDPDADRLGIAVRHDGSYSLVTGNQLGALLAHYRFTQLAANEALPERPAFVKTIVTTELQRRIAESFGAKVYDVLTGFKYIGEKIREFEDTGESYVFGGEESYGYLIETEVRDKDGVSAAALTAEMALVKKREGATLVDYLTELHEQFGYFEEILVSKRAEGLSGREKISDLMSDLRQRAPRQFAGQMVVRIKDYLDGSVREDGRKSSNAIDLPRSNVLQLELENGVFTARPSGTEPKIKFYGSCWGAPGEGVRTSRPIVHAAVERIRDEIESLKM